MRGPKLLNLGRIYRFGLFSLDVSERTLQCDGKLLSLSPKAWEVLWVLIAHRGRVVEKQMLMEKVWPGIFVEENNLAFNISVLRKVLGENAAAPKFIETVPKRGYRFIAEVEEDSSAERNPELPTKKEISAPRGAEFILRRGSTRLLRISPHDTEIPKANAQAGNAIAKRWKSLTAIALGIASLLALAALHYANHPKLNGEDTILLAGFTNNTGEPVFDGALDRGLAIELEQSPFLSLIPERRVRQVLRLMGQPSDAQMNPDAARDLCRRAGGAAFLQGNVSRLGG